MTCNHGPFKPTRPSTKENRIWDEMMAKYGVYELARRIARRKTYREYVGHWPYDHTEATVSLDMLHEVGFDPPTTEDIAESYMIDDAAEEFIATLTPKQQSIIRKLIDGNRPKDIFEEEGYMHTGGIRYHKWLMRSKWRRFRENNPQA